MDRIINEGTGIRETTPSEELLMWDVPDDVSGELSNHGKRVLVAYLDSKFGMLGDLDYELLARLAETIKTLPCGK